jgi:hypothetical protein
MMKSSISYGHMPYKILHSLEKRICRKQVSYNIASAYDLT